MSEYTINKKAIDAFKSYHGLKNDREVSEIMGISSAYYSQIISGTKSLNEHIRLRIQMITNLSQDVLFIPNFESDLFDSDHLMLKRKYGILPLLSPLETDTQLTFSDMDIASEITDSRHHFLTNKYRKFWNKS